MIQRAPDRRPRGNAREWRGRAVPRPSPEALAMFAVALLLRVAYAWVVHGPAAQPSSDSLTYDTIAWNLARGMGYQLVGAGGPYPTAFVPPMLPLALSLLYRVVGHSFWAGVLLMCVFGALVPPLTRELGRAMFGPSVGRIASWLAAVHPLLVFFSGYVLTESLFTAELLLGLLASVAWMKHPTARHALLAGIAWGVASLTRPTALPLVFLIVAWAWAPLGLVLAPGERRRQAFVLLLGTALCVAPWTLRNAVAMHAFVPLTSHGGRTLLDANNPVVWDDPALRGGNVETLSREPWASRYHGLPEVELDRRAGQDAKAFILSRPGDWPRVAWAKLARFWRWSAMTPSTGNWAGEQASLARRLMALDPLLPWSIALFPCAIWGLVRTLRGSRRHFQSLPLLVIAAFSAIAVVYWGALRMRVPVEPLVVLYAGAGIADVWWRVRVRRAGLELISTQKPTQKH